MACISFSFYKSYFYFLIYWILDLSITIVRDLYLMEEIKDIEFKKGTEFVYISCINIADLFAGFLVFCTYRKMKTIEYKEKEKEKNKKKERQKNKKNRKKLNIELIYNDLSIREHKNTYLFFISVLEFLARCTDLFFLLFLQQLPIRIGQVNWLISVDTFARIIFSRIFLKTKLYKHHYFSIIVTVIGLLVMSLCALKSLSDIESERWPYFLFVIAKYLLLPLEDVFNKILLTDEFMLPHYLMFWRGIFDFIFLIILGSAVIIPGFVTFHYFEQFHGTLEILTQVSLKILFTIFSFCKTFCLLKILDIFSPQHVAFCNTAFSLYQLFKCRCKSHDNKVIMSIDATFLAIIIIATLIFNEVLIVNCFGLNRNTKKGFLEKAKIELQEIKDGDSSDDEDNSEDNEKVVDTKDENINKKDNNYYNTGSTDTFNDNNSGNRNSVSGEDTESRDISDF